MSSQLKARFTSATQQRNPQHFHRAHTGLEPFCTSDPQAYAHTAGQQSSYRAGSQRQISAPGLRDSPGTPEARTQCG